jgi:hypothetical protein
MYIQVNKRITAETLLTYFKLLPQDFLREGSKNNKILTQDSRFQSLEMPHDRGDRSEHVFLQSFSFSSDNYVTD